jgi:hypothetical protein
MAFTGCRAVQASNQTLQRLLTMTVDPCHCLPVNNKVHALRSDGCSPSSDGCSPSAQFSPDRGVLVHCTKHLKSMAVHGCGRSPCLTFTMAPIACRATTDRCPCMARRTMMATDFTSVMARRCFHQSPPMFHSVFTCLFSHFEHNTLVALIWIP